RSAGDGQAGANVVFRREGCDGGRGEACGAGGTHSGGRESSANEKYLNTEGRVSEAAGCAQAPSEHGCDWSRAGILAASGWIAPPSPGADCEPSSRRGSSLGP